MSSGLLRELATRDAWGVVVVTAALGALGAIGHALVTQESGASKWKAALLGAIAANGLSAFTQPATAIELFGLALLAGFIANSVLAMLDGRIALAFARQEADRALAVAADAIELSRKQRGATAPASELEVYKLTARLDEVRVKRRTP